MSKTSELDQSLEKTPGTGDCSSLSSLDTIVISGYSRPETKAPIRFYVNRPKFSRPSKEVFDRLQPIAYAFWDQYVDKELSGCSSFLIVPSVLDGQDGIYVGAPNPETLSLPSRFHGTPLFVCENHVRRLGNQFRDFYKNPLAPGASISREDSTTNGTLGGMILVDQEPHAITNWHVAPPHTGVQNPSGWHMRYFARVKPDFEKEIAELDDLCFGVATEFGYSGKFNNGQTLDYSLIKLLNRTITNQVYVEDGEFEFCIDRPYFDLNSPEVAHSLFANQTEFGKIGAGTGYRFARLYSDTPNCIVLAEYSPPSERDQIEPLNARIKTSFEFLLESGNDDEPFADRGDSGAIVYIDKLGKNKPEQGINSAVSLLWSATSASPFLAVATPFGTIIKHFNQSHPGHQIEFPLAVQPQLNLIKLNQS